MLLKIHYHPSSPTKEEYTFGFLKDGDFEFLELRNISSEAVHFGGVHFVDGIELDFKDSVTKMFNPQDRVMLVSHREAFSKHYGEGVKVAGDHTGRLKNSGERLRLADFQGNAIIDVTYNDKRAWPKTADGDGPRLVRLPSPTDSAFAWRLSRALLGAPGIDDRIIEPDLHAIRILTVAPHGDGFLVRSKKNSLPIISRYTTKPHPTSA